MLSDGIAAGQAFFILLCAGVLTIPLALFLLWRYGRAVQREMTGASPSAMEAAAPPQHIRDSSLPPLQLLDLDVTADISSPAYNRTRRSLRNTVLVYAVAGLAYALPFAMAWSYQADGALLAWRRITLLAGVQYWPTVIAISVIAATSRIERARIFLWLFAGLAAFSIYELAISPDLTIGQLVKLWLVTNGPPTLLITPLLFRRVRAIAPLVLAFLLVIVTGALVVPSAMLLPPQGMAWVVRIGTALGLSGTAIFYAIHAIGLAVFAIPGWWLLKYFGGLYRRKRTSDQSIMLDSLYFIFAFEQSLVISAQGHGRFLGIGLLSFVAYKLVKWVGFRLTQRKQPEAAPVLLLLRVFALQSRSERLFDSLTKWWRRAGSMVMIAGPDLIRSTIQPHELLEFIGGKIARQFVAGPDQLLEQVADIDLLPDPDGRYRINQFFCHRDTWQPTMRELAKHSSAVLMDLRSFSARNQGCIYELGELLKSVSLGRVIFLVDATTDRAFLEQTLQQLWQRVGPDSPNSATAQPTVRLFAGSLDSAAQFRHLVQRLVAPGDAGSAAAGA